MGFDASMKGWDQNLSILNTCLFLYIYTFPRSNDFLLSNLVTTLITKALRMPLFSIFYNQGLLPVDLMLNGMQVMLVYTVETFLLPNPHDSTQEAIVFVPGSGWQPGDVITLWKGLLLFVFTVYKVP